MKVFTGRNGEQIGFEQSPKWVRVRFGDANVADSRRAHLLLPGGPPYYYFPWEDVLTDLLEASGRTEESPLLGRAAYWDLRTGSRTAESAAWSYPEPVSDALDLSGFVAFDWDKMDAWFEEAEEVFVHPHDPYKRLDVHQSRRHVRVVVLGETVAESHSPILLFETGLPTRYYLSKLDVRMDLLVPTDTVTGCAYKGEANYYSVRIGDRTARDICWYYRYPTNPMAKIATHMAFFNERVDALYVDGIEQPRPRTRWSLD